ncbi:hypothetical protein DL93DRAFT_2152536 [Clavulina sp. PMI_390]|nr:hypothetical protein DL93DRAFT_2152536 [Clavulina sp. PMI_390]
MITIYLGMITDRIPVLPAISRSHHVFPTNDIWLGDIFDLGELAEKIRHPILEWPSVKKIDSLQVETLGCWSHWLLLGDSQTRNTNVPNDLRLDLSYTSVPEWAKLEQSSHILQIWSLATLGFHEGHSRGVSGNQPLASPLNGAIEPPDQHLLCLDSLYFTGFVYNIDSFDSGHAPVWRAVAQYARFLPSVNRLAKTYIRRAFGLAETDEIPQFIAIHIRRSDFADWCRPPDIIEDCLPQLDAFVLRVKEVEAELQSRDKGIQLPMRVLVTSDEPYTVDRAGHDGVVTKVANPYWQKISDLGWNYVNHDAEQTVVKHGAYVILPTLFPDNFYAVVHRAIGISRYFRHQANDLCAVTFRYLPLIIDQAVHSLAIGFVGTDLSTMSRMGALRVETWNGGITRKVMWGNKKADIH